MVMINFLTQEKSPEESVTNNKFKVGDEINYREMQDGKVPQEILDFISTTILPSPTFKSIQKEAEKHFRKSQAKGQLHPFSHTYSSILKD